MFTPRQYRVDDPAREARLIRENPFGLLISTFDGAPVASHVPMLRRPGPAGTPSDDHPLSATTLVGHMARANDQWRALSPGQRVLAVFSGPDGYVTPTLYGKDNVAPTWNYAAVHVTGTIRVIDNPAEALAVIHATIDLTEATTAPRWDPGPSSSYIERILSGITAFEITVAEVQSIFKLSQDKDAGSQRRIRDYFAHSSCGREPELAALMTDVLGLDQR